MSALNRWHPRRAILAAVALALTGLISPPPPVAGSAASDVVAYYAGHRVGLEIESVADGVGIILLVIFAATFHARIRTGLSMTAFVGAAITAASTLVQVAALHSLAFRPNPEPVRAALLNDFQSFTFQVTTFPNLLFLGAAAAAIIVSGELPRWRMVAAGLQAVSWISFFRTTGAPGGWRLARHSFLRCFPGVGRRLLGSDAGAVPTSSGSPTGIDSADGAGE